MESYKTEKEAKENVAEEQTLITSKSEQNQESTVEACIEYIKTFDEILQSDRKESVCKVLKLIGHSADVGEQSLNEILIKEHFMEKIFGLIHDFFEEKDIILGCSTLGKLCIINSPNIIPDIMIFANESLLSIETVNADNDELFSGFLTLVTDAMCENTIGVVSPDLAAKLLELAENVLTPRTTEAIYKFARKIVLTSYEVRRQIRNGVLEEDESASYNVASLDLLRFVIGLINIDVDGHETMRAQLFFNIIASGLLPYEFNIDESCIKLIEDIDESELADKTGTPVECDDEIDADFAIHYTVIRLSCFDEKEVEARSYLYRAICKLGDMRLVSLRLCHLLLDDLMREEVADTVGYACKLLSKFLEQRGEAFKKFFMEFNCYIDYMIPTLIKLVLSGQINVLRRAGNLLNSIMSTLPNYFDNVELWKPSGEEGNTDLGVAICRLLSINDIHGEKKNLSLDTGLTIEKIFTFIKSYSPENVDEFLQATIDNGIKDALEECTDESRGDTAFLFQCIIDDVYKSLEDDDDGD